MYAGGSGSWLTGGGGGRPEGWDVVEISPSSAPSFLASGSALFASGRNTPVPCPRPGAGPQGGWSACRVDDPWVGTQGPQGAQPCGGYVIAFPCGCFLFCQRHRQTPYEGHTGQMLGHSYPPYGSPWLKPTNAFNPGHDDWRLFWLSPPCSAN